MERYGGKRWKGFGAGPQALRKAAPGPMNRGEGRLAAMMLKTGTPTLPGGSTVGSQNPRLSPSAGGRTPLTAHAQRGRLKMRRSMARTGGGVDE